MDAARPGFHSRRVSVRTPSPLGEARIHADVQPCRDGDLLALWEAFRTRADRGERIDSVEWYDGGRGFRAQGPVRLVPFPAPVVGGRPVSRTGPGLPTVTYSARLARAPVCCRRRIDYVLDIERWPTSSRKTAERFRGLAFTLHNDADLERWLRRLLVGLPDKCGVVGSLLEECPGRAALFKHSRSGSGLSEATARNALAKLFGLLFPDGRSSEP